MYRRVDNVHVAGIAACVPKTVQLIEQSDYATLQERQKFIKTTGIKSRRISSVDQCTSDLCFESAKVLLQDLDWKKSDIDYLLFVTQTPDYILPSTAIVLQDRLGLPTSCAAFDINLGCSGYTYGLGVLASLLQGKEKARGLLLAGDTPTKGVLPSSQKTVPPLFGDCGSATAVELCAKKGSSLFMDFYSDGSGAKVIQQKYGAYRYPFKPDQFRTEINQHGNVEIDTGFVLDGIEVFNFSVQKVPGAVRELLKQAACEAKDVDFFVLHQANKLMNEIIRKQIGVPLEKYLYSLETFGNTSVATIPLTIVDQLKGCVAGRKILCCGFGVGLSWGTTLHDFSECVVPEVIEV